MPVPIFLQHESNLWTKDRTLLSSTVSISWNLVIIYERMFYSVILSVSSIVPPNLLDAI